jgi:hypothetical protein
MRYQCLNRSGQRTFVRPTLETILPESPAHLRKRLGRCAGLALIWPDSENA